MRGAAFLATVAVVLAGCGSTHRSNAHATTAAAGPAATVGTGARTLYRSTNGWAVVQQGATAVALHLVGRAWMPDRSGAVRVRILGPQNPAPRRPQVAVEISASHDLVETALWVDGEELLEKGGGSPRRGTIYGTTAAPLSPGPHIAVAYGRAGTAATARAWRFRVG